MVGEAAPGFGHAAQFPEHVLAFIDAVIGQVGDGITPAQTDADDPAVDQVVAVMVDRVERLRGMAVRIAGAVTPGAGPEAGGKAGNARILSDDRRGPRAGDERGHKASHRLRP